MSSQLQQARKERDEALAEVDRMRRKVVQAQEALAQIAAHARAMAEFAKVAAVLCAVIDLEAPIPPIDATTDEPPGAPAAARPDVSIHRGPLSWRLGDPEPQPEGP